MWVRVTDNHREKHGLRFQYGEGCDYDSNRLKEEANGPVIQIENGDFIQSHH